MCVFHCMHVCVCIRFVTRMCDVINVVIVSGVSILRILFSGYAHYSQILLPLLVYHPTQIILGGMLVPTMKKWLTRAKAR